MFVAFSHDHHIHIDRIRMDGSLQHRSHVVEDGLLGPHVTLHYDEDMERVFWADTFTGHIESTDVQGKGSIPGYHVIEKRLLMVPRNNNTLSYVT